MNRIIWQDYPDDDPEDDYWEPWEDDEPDDRDQYDIEYDR